MKRKNFVLLLALMPSFILVPAYPQDKDAELWEKAKQIHFEAIVFDAHVHPMKSPDAHPKNLDLGKITKYSVVDFTSMTEGGLDAAFFSLPLLNVNAVDRGNPTKRVLDEIVILRRHIEKYSQFAEIALSPSDIRRIHDSGKRAILFSIETQNCMEGHTVLLEAYYKMGVRLITVANSPIDPIADTRSENAGENGLSQFGREVVREMNRLGMLIDISHAPDSLQLSIIEESKAPILASHSCLRAINDKPREIPDVILKEMAKKGGAIMLAFSSSHFSSEDEAANIERLIDHVDHAVEIAGIDHVGLGSDFISGTGNPAGLETAAGYPLITFHLLKRGYSAEEIKKILGENLLQLFSDVQNISFPLRSQ